MFGRLLRECVIFWSCCCYHPWFWLFVLLLKYCLEHCRNIANYYSVKEAVAAAVVQRQQPERLVVVLVQQLQQRMAANTPYAFE